jgi:uroporphyrinogen-III decarboxylase
MLAYCEEGLMPLAFAEGSYNMRLDIIADFPKAQCVWQFDRTDMGHAKEALKDIACIMGNVPTSIMATGTPDSVKAYCKNLIDVCGKNGGFIMTNGGLIDYAKPENIRAMIDFTKAYGVYR